MKLPAALLAGLWMAATPVHAASVLYECNLKAQTRWGWIPAKMWISYDAARSRGWVMDRYVHSVQDKPITAAVTKRDANSVQMKWTVPGLAMKNGAKAKADYTALFWPGTGKLSLTSYVKGFDNQNRGTGTCAPKKK